MLFCGKPSSECHTVWTYCVMGLCGSRQHAVPTSDTMRNSKRLKHCTSFDVQNRASIASKTKFIGNRTPQISREGILADTLGMQRSRQNSQNWNIPKKVILSPKAARNAICKWLNLQQFTALSGQPQP